MIVGEFAKGVAFISSYSPRKCGIAIFTSDLIANMKMASGREFEQVVLHWMRPNKR